PRTQGTRPRACRTITRTTRRCPTVRARGTVTVATRSGTGGCEHPPHPSHPPDPPHTAQKGRGGLGGTDSCGCAVRLRDSTPRRHSRLSFHREPHHAHPHHAHALTLRTPRHAEHPTTPHP